MKTKYYCEECCELYEKKDIAYNYTLNVSGKYPTKFYVCKSCNKEEEK